MKHLSFLPARSRCLTRVKCVNFRPFSYLAVVICCSRDRFFFFFFLLPLFRFPLQLFRQLDPPRSLSAFLRNMLLVVARPLQDSDSQSGFPALRLQSAAVPASPALSFSQRPFPNRARSRCVCHQDAVMGWRLSSIPTPSGPPPPCNRGDTHPVSHSQVFLGLVGVCEKAEVSARRGRISAQSSAICFVPPRGPGVAFPAQVTTKKYGLMKEETFLEPPVMCRRVFMSAAVAVDRLDPLLCW